MFRLRKVAITGCVYHKHKKEKSIPAALHVTIKV